MYPGIQAYPATIDAGVSSVESTMIRSA